MTGRVLFSAMELQCEDPTCEGEPLNTTELRAVSQHANPYGAKAHTRRQCPVLQVLKEVIHPSSAKELTHYMDNGVPAKTDVPLVAATLRKRCDTCLKQWVTPDTA